ncbi:MAG: hypothetical protein ACLQLC_02270 [Candidatus Sulfotelmatobacter sp.]
MSQLAGKSACQRRNGLPIQSKNITPFGLPDSNDFHKSNQAKRSPVMSLDHNDYDVGGSKGWLVSVAVEIRGVSSRSADSRLRFEFEKSGAILIRHLRLDDRRAYEFGITCNTCQFWFERKSGANGSLPLENIADTLNDGLTTLEAGTTQSIADSLPSGDYIAILSRITPKLVQPSEPDDYFSHEQVQLWGIDGFWGLPHHPRTEYYRTGSRVFNGKTELFEFVVPMFPHGWLKSQSLASYQEKLKHGKRPTAVALSFLDVKSPAVFGGNKERPTISEHWCFPSLLIDGHHKTFAAAELGMEMTLLTFLASSEGTADPSQIDALLLRR